MSKTHRPELDQRIDRYVHRRHTHLGYDRLMELARLDFARQVAFDVSPGQRRQPASPTMCYASLGFGVPKPCASCLSPADCRRTRPSCFK